MVFLHRIVTFFVKFFSKELDCEVDWLFFIFESCKPDSEKLLKNENCSNRVYSSVPVLVCWLYINEHGNWSLKKTPVQLWKWRKPIARQLRPKRLSEDKSSWSNTSCQITRKFCVRCVKKYCTNWLQSIAGPVLLLVIQIIGPDHEFQVLKPWL